MLGSLCGFLGVRLFSQYIYFLNGPNVFISFFYICFAFGILYFLKQDRKVTLPVYARLLLVLAPILIFSSILNGNYEYGIELSFKLTSGFLMVAYLSNLSKVKLNLFLVSWFYLSTLTLLLYIINSYVFLGSPFLVNSLDSITTVGRNQLAFYVVLTSAILLYYNLVFRSSLIFKFAFAVHVLALLYLFSRGALLAFSIPIFILCFYYVFIKLSFRSLLYSLFISIAFIFILYSSGVADAFVQRVTSIATLSDGEGENSISSRVEFISKAYDIYAQSPFFGVGAGGFRDATGRETHNSYIEYLVEFGLFGVIVIFIKFFAPIMSILRNTDYSLRTNNTLFVRCLILLPAIIYPLFINVSFAPVYFVFVGSVIALTSTRE